MKALSLFATITIFANSLFGQSLENKISYRAEVFLGRVSPRQAEIFRNYKVENEELIIRDFYLDGTFRGTVKGKNGASHGLYLGYYKTGQLRDSGNYHKGDRWGSWKVFHKNGQLKLLANFKDDLIDGNVIHYDSVGQLISKRKYKKGNPLSWIDYYPGTSQIKEETLFVSGKVEGESKYYFPDGRLKRIETYKEGKYVEGSGKVFNYEGVEIPYTPILKPLSFKGDLSKYIYSNMRYPKKSLEDNVQGVVYVKAEINEKGDVTDAGVSLGINPECNQEALRIVKSLKFNPAVYDEIPRDCVRSIVIVFSVNAFLKQQYLNKEKADQEVMQEIEDNSNPFR